MKTFRCPLSLILSDVLSLSVSLSISSDGTIFLCVLQSFSCFYVSFHLFPLSSTQALLRHINFSHFYLAIISFCLPAHTYTFPPPSFFSDFSAPASLIIFHLFTFLSLINTIMLPLMCASPRVCP